jgi:hypothetical protein
MFTFAAEAELRRRAGSVHRSSLDPIAGRVVMPLITLIVRYYFKRIKQDVQTILSYFNIDDEFRWVVEKESQRFGKHFVDK